MTVAVAPGDVFSYNNAVWADRDRLKAIFLDYDGTLREFEARPELASPTSEVHELIAALDARPDLRVHIVSGRDAKFLSECFGRYRRITLIAEHEMRLRGRFQIWQAGTEPRPSSPTSPKSLEADKWVRWKASVHVEMEKVAAEIAGSHLEEKTCSLVWHYREVDSEAVAAEAASQLIERLTAVNEEFAVKDCRVAHGHKIVEISLRWAGGSKGTAVNRITEDRRSRGEDDFAAMLVAGDDVSDESMFEVAPQDALTVKVGGDSTLARFSVESPDHLRQLVWRVIGE